MLATVADSLLSVAWHTRTRLTTCETSLSINAMENDMHSSLTIANRFWDLAQDARAQLTPMQMLKLVFLAHGWMLGLHGRPLIRDRIEAWKYGPVIPTLYHEIKAYRGSPIRSRLAAPRTDRISGDADDIISQVFEIYGDWSGPELSQLTHERDSPWDQVFDEVDWGQIIPTGVIRNYYEQLARSK